MGMVREWVGVEVKGSKSEVNNMGKGKKKVYIYCACKLAFIPCQSTEVSTKFLINLYDMLSRFISQWRSNIT